MITKDIIKKQESEIKGQLDRFYGSLEDLWEAAMNRDYNKITRLVDRLQNFGDDCVARIKFKVQMLADDAYELIDILDKKPELRMLDDALGIINDIKGRLNFWEKKKAELEEHQAKYSAGEFVDEEIEEGE